MTPSTLFVGQTAAPGERQRRRRGRSDSTGARSAYPLAYLRAFPPSSHRFPSRPTGFGIARAYRLSYTHMTTLLEIATGDDAKLTPREVAYGQLVADRLQARIDAGLPSLEADWPEVEAPFLHEFERQCDRWRGLHPRCKGGLVFSPSAVGLWLDLAGVPGSRLQIVQARASLPGEPKSPAVIGDSIWRSVMVEFAPKFAALIPRGDA